MSGHAFDLSRSCIVQGADGAIYVDVDDETLARLREHFRVEEVPESEVLDAICEESR